MRKTVLFVLNFPHLLQQSVFLAAVYGLVASLMCAKAPVIMMMSLCQLGVAFAAPSNWIPSTPSTRLGSLARGRVALLVLGNRYLYTNN